jgi:lipoate-protein ligase A
MGRRGGLFVAPGRHSAGRKVSGTARRIGARAVMHHGTILVDADIARLGACLGGIETAQTRALPSVSSPVVNLAALLPGLGSEEVAAALAAEFLGAPQTRSAVPAWDDALAAAGPEGLGPARARLRSWSWTWGQTPPFTLSLASPDGKDELRIEVRSGRIESLSGSASGAELHRFLGQAFDYTLPRDIAAALWGGASKGRALPDERHELQLPEGRS